MAEELAKKCRGKGQKCCSASDSEDMSKRIFRNKDERLVKISQNDTKKTTAEESQLVHTCTGPEKALGQKCYRWEKMVLLAACRSLMVAEKKERGRVEVQSLGLKTNLEKSERE